MLRALTILVLCQFAGEVTARAAGLTMPGPVLGLLLLLGILAGAVIGFLGSAVSVGRQLKRV